ncbi:hypothetical protein [Pelagicoccus mobilis]|uniref:Uncharacterized protein n=1 Tax=Pelagicoccus mobilis TaxID=415221 RepID=A0A934S321_9BACT|nr:hypothetical protein [Pelagicoccus mobilis]MBK1880184.1 hypothetical protein [Pelagicoccus mobilis]
MRIFTNDVATANALERAEGRVVAVAWQDPLAFGRLIAGNDLDAFANARSFAYASAHWDEDNVVEDDLKLRNAELLAAFESESEVYLLFGGSLADQLSLAQILGWLSERPINEQAKARLMTVDGPLAVFDDGALLEIAKAGEIVPAGTHAIYAVAWDAVSGADPTEVEAALERASSEGLSSLATGLGRWLQELPSVENGLSISQMQVLDTVRLGIGDARELFRQVQSTEATPFRIDWEFWQVVDGLCSGADPLLTTASGQPFLCPPKDLAFEAFDAQVLELTERGRAVLEGRSNYLSGPFAERWLGGAKIDGESPWFWDYASRKVVGAAAAGA